MTVTEFQSSLRLLSILLDCGIKKDESAIRNSIYCCTVVYISITAREMEVFETNMCKRNKCFFDGCEK